MTITFARMYLEATVAATRALTSLATAVRPVAVAPPIGSTRARVTEGDGAAVVSDLEVDPADPLSPTASSLLEALSDEGARAVLTEVLAGETEASRSVEELVPVVAERAGCDRRTARISLVHTTLPKLCRKGLIVWEVEENTVGVPEGGVPTVAFQELLGLLEACHRRSR